MPPSRSSDVDACPGALRLHAAADGPLARVRLPGGMLTGAQLHALLTLAADCGDGFLELTSRANIQLRALRGTDPAELTDRLRQAGLFPSTSHETVRNIAAPALAPAPIRALVTDLDRALCADEALAALPGRFLFAVGATTLTADASAVPVADSALASDGEATAQADGTGEEAGARASGLDEEAAQPVGAEETARQPGSAEGTASRPGGTFAVLLAGQDFGLRISAAQVVPTLLAAAHEFLKIRTERAWRLAEVPDGPNLVAATLRASPCTSPPHPTPQNTTPADKRRNIAHGCARSTAPADVGLHEGGEAALGRDGEPQLSASGEPQPSTGGEAARAAGAGVGVVRQVDGRFAVAALVPLGRLSGVPGEVLSKADRLVVTAERGIVVPDLSSAEAAAWRDRLAAAGLAVDEGDRWTGVTACAGRPGCAKALADVRTDADATTAFVEGRAVHWIGCDRGCGSPAGPHVRVEATNAGYLVDGVTVTGPLSAAVAAARNGSARRA